MNIIIAARTPKQFYNIQSRAEALLARGARVHAYFDENLSRHESRAPLAEWAAGWPNFSFDFRPGRRGIAAFPVFCAREFLSYRRFLLSRSQSRYYAERWRKNLPFPARILSYLPGFSSLLKTKRFAALLRHIEEKTKPVKRIIRILQSEKPDAVVATPTNMHPQSADTEFLKAAKSLGIFTVLPVFTWDNLTTKGLLPIKPDLLLAWNEKQAREAAEYHGIPCDKIEITGSPPFDRWFTLNEPTGRVEMFISQLRSGQAPLLQKRILYVGASQVTAKDETWLVRRIAEALLQSDNEMAKNAVILFRPHPFNREPSKFFIKKPMSNVRVLESESRMPNTRARFNELRAEIIAADAVCGISTSAFVDAVIAGKPVVSVSVPEYKETQEGAKHWRMLRESGAAYIASSAEEAVMLFGEIFFGKAAKKEQREDFINLYIRPFGRNVSAGERAAEAITRGTRGGL